MPIIPHATPPPPQHPYPYSFPPCPRHRAMAALLKELHKSSLAPLATEIFDWLRTLPQGHEYVPLLDVYTYTTMIVSSRGQGGTKGRKQLGARHEAHRILSS